MRSLVAPCFLLLSIYLGKILWNRQTSCGVNQKIRWTWLYYSIRCQWSNSCETSSWFFYYSWKLIKFKGCFVISEVRNSSLMKIFLSRVSMPVTLKQNWMLVSFLTRRKAFLSNLKNLQMIIAFYLFTFLYESATEL